MESEQIVQLDPAKVQALPEENAARFGAASRDGSRQEMMDSILAQGGVMQPVEVVAVSGVKGFSHKLIYGYRRHAAVLELNKSQNAGLTLPAIVREIDPADIIKRQIAENNDRETMSPMDKAVAIKRLVDAGTPKVEIRNIFSTLGGKKGTERVPLSNASLNIYLNFLELPKTIQEKIHTGAVGVSAAYMLGKVAPDKRADVLARAEKERADELAAIERDEAKYLDSERKVEEAKEKVVEAAKSVEDLKADVEAAQALVKVKDKAFADEKKRILTMDEPAGPADAEALKAKEADAKGAHKTYKDATNKLAKALKTQTDAEEKAKEKQAQLEAARSLKKKQGKSKGAGVSRDDVKKAAKKEGTTGAGYVPITLSDFKSALKDLLKEGVPAKTQQIGQCFKDHVDGVTTVKELLHDLGVITGEVKPNAADLKKAQTKKAASTPAAAAASATA